VSGRDGADLAERALRRLAAPISTRPAPFTCDLSVDELVLVERAGLEPVKLVMGTCVVSVLRRPISATGELRHATDAIYRARRLAVEDLRREASGVGAHGVVGVRVEVDEERWGEDLHEFVALGTAVRSRTGSLRTGGAPFTSHLSGQGVHALLAAGYRPLSLVMGAAVWGVSRWDSFAWLSASKQQQVEYTEMTREITIARERAIRRMGVEARSVGAAGVVGMTIQQRSHTWGGDALEFVALGTAIRARDGGPAGPRPRAVVPLDAPSPRAAEIRVDVEPLRRLDN
jgi:uncharacterized protein YbjQ (UPF0145 family)